MPTQTKERVEAREERMFSVSQRLVLVDGSVDRSLQKSQSRKYQDLAKIDHLDLYESHLRGRSLVENMCILYRAHEDEREPRMVKDRLRAASAEQADSSRVEGCPQISQKQQNKRSREQQVGSSRVGRFSVQSAAADAACVERAEPRAPVGRGLRELSPGSNPVNHSRNKKFSSLDLGGKLYYAMSRNLPPLSQNLCINTKTDQKQFKTLQNKKSRYKEPKNRQEFSSYFLHFATPRPFYRAHSFI